MYLSKNRYLWSLQGMELYVLSVHWFQSPVEHVVAVGLGDGRIIVHNLQCDETLMTFKQDWGPVTTISFRTGLLLSATC